MAARRGAHRPELAHERGSRSRAPAGRRRGWSARCGARRRSRARRDGRRSSSPRGRAGTPCRPAPPPRRARARPATPGASAIPPAAITGTRTARDDLRHEREASRAASSRSSVRKWPRWPPASSPCAMIASTPRSSSQRASSTVVAEERIFAPARAHACEQRSATAARSGSSRPAAGARAARPPRRRRRARAPAPVGIASTSSPSSR